MPLIKASADLNIKDGAGNTPLHLAARELEAPMIRLLTEQGADIYAKNNKLERPLDVATRIAVFARANGRMPADIMAMLE